MGQGPQKPDHGGNFFITPRRVIASVAWRHTSYRARAILQAFQYAFDGHNNGEIAFGIHDIGKAIGNQGHALNAKAVAELIEKGFLVCTSDASRALAKVRTYRITFISTGKARDIVPATHDYAEWRPVKDRKFGGADTAPKKAVSVAHPAPKRKVSGADAATQMTESCGFEGPGLGAHPAPLLYNHSTGSAGRSESSFPTLQNLPEMRAADLRAELDVLREWTERAVADLGYGGARMLAQDSGVQEGTLSRFRSGKGLPDRYRIPLQEACARVIPFNKLAA